MYVVYREFVLSIAIDSIAKRVLNGIALYAWERERITCIKEKTENERVFINT